MSHLEANRFHSGLSDNPIIIDIRIIPSMSNTQSMQSVLLIIVSRYQKQPSLLELRVTYVTQRDELKPYVTSPIESGASNIYPSESKHVENFGVETTLIRTLGRLERVLTGGITM